MKISEVLALIRGFTDYIAELGGDVEQYGGEAQTKWDYILGVYGPTPVLYVRGSMSRIFDPLQAVTVGWEEAHNCALWGIRPDEATIKEALGLSDGNFQKLDHAVHLLEPWHKQLRVDLIEACGMEDERESAWFKDTYEREYLARRRRLKSQ